MIKKIIGIADLHIPNFRRIDEYEEHLTNLIESVKQELSNIEPSEGRIVLLGDLIHNKNTISNELIALSSNFIRELEKIAKVYAICGNHDLVLSNTSRLDTISTIFEVSQFNNATFLDSELGYESGVIDDENVLWALFSIYTDYSPLDLSELKQTYKDKKIIGLFHGNLIGSKLPNGMISENGVDAELFKECDIALCGDIHKRQVLKKKGVEIIYSGSPFQQNFGETVTQHGYTVLDIDDKNNISYRFVDMENNYGFYNIEIKDIEDLDNNKEIMINY